MPKLPVLSGKDVIKILSKRGYVFDHQTGSHITLVDQSGKKITVPNHKELGPGILRAIIKQAGFSVDDFLKLL
ncbi:YcfA-like protein [mine drainage metagenome]|uniref:YcfA-like protein n=1 Tax=mine drainage metagenome TaxID=410659 RepID=T0Z1Q9_9ZZZZ